MRSRFIFTVGFAALAAAIACGAQAKDYPERPVRIIVPYAPGGAVDVIARVMAQKLSDGAGGHFYVENLPGAGGDIGTRAVAGAPADGYTLLFTSPDFVTRPIVKVNAPYDPIASFAPISLIATSPCMVTVHSSVPARTMKDLIAVLKANPGKFTLGTPGYGTAPDLDAERLYGQASGVNVVRVPFQGFGPAVTSMVAGHTSLSGAPLPLVAPYIKDGTLRALAIASDRRSAAFPDVPTLAEEGFPDQEAAFTGGVVAPAGTPKEVIDLLHKRIVAIVSLPDVKERLAVLGYDPVASTPDQFSAWIKAEFLKYREVVRVANIRID